MKKFLVVLVLFLVAAASLLGLSGAARAVPTVAPTVTATELGLGKGACFYDGSATGLSTNTKSCIGVAPPPESNCNPDGIQNSTLDVLHEVRDKIDIGGYATFFLFQSDAGGCGSGWSAVHIDSGCHVVSQISVRDSFLPSSASGLDANGVLRCANTQPWESTYMVDAESGSTLSATVTIDFQSQQSASVTV